MTDRLVGAARKKTQRQRTLAMQRFLRKKGYLIDVDGRLGPETKAALDDWHKGKNKRDPDKWNMSQARAEAVQQGPRVPGVGGARGGTTRRDGTGDARDRRDGVALGPAPNFGMPISEAQVGAAGPTLLPDSFAESLAAAEFDSPIRAAQIDIARQPRQAAQNLQDIANWYDQVLRSQATASQRDSEINDAGQGSLEQAIGAIVSSLGGEANQGAGLVGAAGADALGTLGAIGTAQEQYNQDIAPLLKAEGAGARSREMAQQTALAQDLRNQLIDLTRQRGASKGASLFDIRRDNNTVRQQRLQNLMGARGFNNQLAQQEFSNDLALKEMEIAAMGMNLDIAKAMTPEAPKGSYADTGANQKLAVMDKAVGEVRDPNTGELRYDVPRTVQLVNSMIAGAGWSRRNPEVLAFRNEILRAVGINPDPRWK